MKPGTLYLSRNSGLIKSRFCEIRNDSSGPFFAQTEKSPADRISVKSGDVIMFVEELDLTEETFPSLKFRRGPGDRVAVIVATAATAMATSIEWNQAYHEWRDSRKIRGSIFLHPNGKTIWISHIDLKYFQELNPLFYC